MAAGLPKPQPQYSGDFAGSQPRASVGACPTAHISPQPRKQQDPFTGSSYLLTTHAGMIKLTENITTEVIQKGGGPRGQVQGLSYASRRRALRTLCMVRGQGRGVFLTLTYSDAASPLWSRNKAHLDKFLKRLRRHFPDAGYFWRIEYQRRKSGDNVGTPVPHFHLLIFGIPGTITDFRAWVAQAWFEVVGTGDQHHRRAGTEASHIKSRRHAMRYASKYMTKDDPDLIDEVGVTGRMWGYGGELDLSSASVGELLRSEYVELRRLVKRWLKANRCSYADRIAICNHGFTALGIGDEADPDVFLIDRLLAAIRAGPYKDPERYVPEIRENGLLS